MKKFKFSMSGVMNVKRTVKEVCEMRFVEAKRALAEEIRKREAIDAERRKAMARELIFKYPTGAYFLQREKYLKILRDRGKKQDIAVRFAKAKVSESLRELRKAMVELEKMEKCQERERQEWQLEFNREERKINDEIGTSLARYKENLFAV